MLVTLRNSAPTAHENGGTFVTHNRRDFDNPPLNELTNVDVVHSE